MKNLKVRAKLIVAFGTILVLVLCMVACVFVSLSITMGSTDEFYDEAFTGVVYADKLNNLVISTSSDLLYAVGNPNTTASAASLDKAKADLESMLETLTQYRAIFDGDTANLDEIEKQVTELQQIVNNDSAVLTGEDTNAAFALFENEVVPATTSLGTLTTGVATYEKEHADNLYNEIKNNNESTTIVVAIVNSLVIAVGVFFAIYITKMLRKSIEDVHEAVTKMANGNFNVTVNYKSKDEIGQAGVAIEKLAANTNAVIGDIDKILDEVSKGNFAVKSQNPELYIGVFSKILNSINDLTATLNNTMRNIDIAAAQVSAGSDQVSAGAQSLSQGATEQAASIEELSATISIIVEMVNSVAKDAENANSKSTQAGEQLGEANSKMEELVVAMAGIKESSEKIQEIIKAIEDIAFQTNILSLNAAVEAARAGEAGKGFAVVADEVRNLASKSAQAAQNTQELIESTVIAIANGNNLVTNVAQNMAVVSESTEEVVESNTRISRSAREVADAVKQVTTGVDQISTVVQTNSATSEESAAASEELSGQATILKDMLDKFTLTNVTASSYAEAVEEAEIAD